MNAGVMLWWLIVGHAVADFPLQTDTMAKGKNRHSPPFNVPVGQVPMRVWPYWLASHALVHGGIVALVTGNVWLGIAEFVAHCLIDAAKCENLTTIHQDQALHIGCKLLWVVLA